MLKAESTVASLAICLDSELAGDLAALLDGLKVANSVALSGIY